MKKHWGMEKDAILGLKVRQKMSQQFDSVNMY